MRTYSAYSSTWPLSLQDTVLLRGIYECVRHNDKSNKHPLDFACTLRLSGAYNWYGPERQDEDNLRWLWMWVGNNARNIIAVDWRVISQHFNRLSQKAQDNASSFFNLAFLPQPERLIYMSLPEHIMLELNSKLASLEQALVDKDPQMPIHLQQSHALLLSYPECVALLTDEQSAVLIAGLQAHTKTEIVKATSKPATKKKIDISDL